MTLPLPLAPFEEYMLRDGRPAYSMDLFFRVRFLGQFARAALQSALAATVRRHPLLRAVVRRNGRGRLQWHPAAEDSQEIHWFTGSAGASLPIASAIDLSRESGVRLSVFSQGERCDLVAQFHHACCDGLGAMQFLEDLLVTYAGTSAGSARPPLLPPLREQALRTRARFGLSVWRSLTSFSKHLAGLRRARRFLSHRPAPLAAEKPAGPPPTPHPALCSRRLTAEETSALLLAARRDRVTLNDLLLRDWFLAMGDFRAKHYPGGGDDWMRLAVPMNLRGPHDEGLPAANVVSMVFLDRRPSELADGRQLLGGIHREMDQIKRGRLGLTFVVSLAAARAVPGCLALLTRADRCRATAVLSNLGTLLRHSPLPTRDGLSEVGDMLIEAIDMLSPLRPHTHASVGVLTYAGRLQISLRYDAGAIQPAQADDLVDAFATRLRASAAAGGEPPTTATVVEHSPAVVERSPAVVEPSPAVVEPSPAVVERSPDRSTSPTEGLPGSPPVVAGLPTVPRL